MKMGKGYWDVVAMREALEEPLCGRLALCGVVGDLSNVVWVLDK